MFCVCPPPPLAKPSPHFPYEKERKESATRFARSLPPSPLHPHTHTPPPPARPHIARTHMPTGRHPHGPHSHPHSCTTQLHPYQHSCNTQKPTHTHIPPRSVDLLVCRLKRELPDTTAPAGTKMTSPPILVIGQTYRVIISRRSDGVVFPTDIGYVHSMGSPPGFD